jgi:ATP-binding cassette, subfamily C (CFTR/MRP), member 1
MIGSRSTGALIAMIYKKQLRLSSATNKEFRQGQIINFIQTDANKLQWLSTALP